MIIAFWCVLFAAFLPMACSYIAKFNGSAGVGGARYDNRQPRAWLAPQTGMRARADAAQANSFEAFPLFAAAVIIAVLQHVPVATIDGLALVFVVARVAYIACYLTDLPKLRSPVWAIGFLACVALFVYAAAGTLR